MGYVKVGNQKLFLLVTEAIIISFLKFVFHFYNIIHLALILEFFVRLLPDKVWGIFWGNFYQSEVMFLDTFSYFEHYILMNVFLHNTSPDILPADIEQQYQGKQYG